MYKARKNGCDTTLYKTAYAWKAWLAACLLLMLSITSSYASGESHQNSVSKNQWLNRMFPTVNNCTPKNWYFDPKVGRSNDRVLEDKGYKAYSVDENAASYRVRELFYGFEATEVSIPSGSVSIYTVTVRTQAHKLAEEIHNITGQKIKLYKGKPAQSGRAYIVEKEEAVSMYVCFTFEEGF
jgi:hypothetical protein